MKAMFSSRHLVLKLKIIVTAIWVPSHFLKKNINIIFLLTLSITSPLAVYILSLSPLVLVNLKIIILLLYLEGGCLPTLIPNSISGYKNRSYFPFTFAYPSYITILLRKIFCSLFISLIWLNFIFFRTVNFYHVYDAYSLNSISWVWDLSSDDDKNSLMSFCCMFFICFNCYVQVGICRTGRLSCNLFQSLFVIHLATTIWHFEFHQVGSKRLEFQSCYFCMLWLNI